MSTQNLTWYICTTIMVILMVYYTYTVHKNSTQLPPAVIEKPKVTDIKFLLWGIGKLFEEWYRNWKARRRYDFIWVPDNSYGRWSPLVNRLIYIWKRKGRMGPKYNVKQIKFFQKRKSKILNWV